MKVFFHVLSFCVPCVLSVACASTEGVGYYDPMGQLDMKRSSDRVDGRYCIYSYDSASPKYVAIPVHMCNEHWPPTYEEVNESCWNVVDLRSNLPEPMLRDAQVIRLSGRVEVYSYNQGDLFFSTAFCSKGDLILTE